MGDTLRKLLGLFERAQYWRLAALLAAMVATGLLQTAGIASIVPFLAVVSNPGAIAESRYLSWAYESLGFRSERQFLISLGVLFIVVMMLSNGFAALTIWATTRVRWRSQDRISQRLLARYLRAPYSFHVSQHSARMGKRLLDEVGIVIGEVFMPYCRILSRGIASVFIVALLVWADPVLAFVVPATIGGFYALVYASVRTRQQKLGEEGVLAKTRLFQIANEAFGGIKDLKVLGREAHFLERFGEAAARFSRARRRSELVGVLPRFVLDGLAYSGIIVVVLYLLYTRDSVDDVFPLLALYAFGANRLIPGVQEIFTSVTQIRFNAAALDGLHADLRDLSESSIGPGSPAGAVPTQTGGVALERAIRIERLSFAYPQSEAPVLRDITLEIPVRSTCAFVGSTGSGKTTLADLLLGLYEPTGGRILIDDVVLDEALLPAWRRMIGYVPQSVFLSDASITQNIAFGVPDHAIDRAAVRAAARAAHLDDFAESLPNGYDTMVGERGVRLSGGQRQRIGIARALYHSPDVLIMDEATSALDTVTEDAVMQAIAELAGSRTIVLIAHRLTTVQDCDVIFVLEGGRLTGQGTYRELVESNPTFRAMTRA